MKTYDPQKIIASFREQVLGGYADGTMVNIEPRSPSFDLTIGTQGDGARVASADRSAKIEITLLQTSQSNDFLAACHEIDRLTKAGGGPFLLKDAGGTTIASSAYAWVVQSAPIEFGKEIVGRKWELETDVLEMFAGGSLA